MPLTKRLGVIAGLIPAGARVADVGTDHGYLPVLLIKGGAVRSVIATDLREKPLESARRHIEASGLTGIDLRLCDGLSAVKEGEADTVVIAGMGGDVISGIISRCSWIKNPGVSLILQPMTSAEELRHFLSENCLRINTEHALRENGRLYSVISAEFDGMQGETDAGFTFIGKVSPDTEDGLAYIKKQLDRCRSCAQALESVPEKREEYNTFRSAAEYIAARLNESDGHIYGV